MSQKSVARISNPSIATDELEAPTYVESPHTIACPRIKVSKLGNLLPTKYIESMEQNQQIHTCCRHPENHDIEAFKSTPEQAAPDIYIMYCVCGRKHIRFCVGGGDVRPFWEVV